ncbi:beta-ketoacyl-ACP synthase III [Halieaceae bacterium IMCC14734]|uniref:Beta-ketoacyl-ACP synthase III n=1 Tax=Candidatus Litorirhabdus singularis TaxID=2518993 RepID=A0ABT3THK8_9GAMM|nr:beta-ketoacyl-ACP synthase III [Candidatus Litorirhabdus singularis]MCX2981484.1 beta-ketoacyl-ACP synthase III [Candidatus Litorirhabdus singularis]
MSAIVISGTGLFTPEQSISNAELVESFNTWVDSANSANAIAINAGEQEPLQHSSVEFIEKASGIKSRYVIDKTGILDPERMAPRIPERPNTEPSLQCEIGVAAARQALSMAGKTPQDVDAVLVACSNLQRAYPAMAVELQAALGIEGWGYDMNVACSSATFALQQARDSIANGSARCVLIINPEICSGHLNFRDRDAHFIFGDVCTAMVVESAETATSESQFEILGARLQTSFSNNIRNNFGFLNRADETGAGQPDKLFVQNGRKVFKEVCPMVAEQIVAHLESLELTPEQLKRMWLHQANLSMNQLIGKRVLGREASAAEAPTILDEYANTSSAGSVIAFHKYNDDFASGDLGVLCSFGAGYSIGSIVLRKV